MRGGARYVQSGDYGDEPMWRVKIPRRNPDGVAVAGFVVGLPALFLIYQGAPVLWTLLTAAIVAGFLVLSR
jgi:hypothetical protein